MSNTPTPRKVTIYRKNDMLGNIVKVEARAFDVERRPYAQYSSAIKVTFVKKGARRVLGFFETYRPHLLVLEGHGHPDPAGLFDGGKVTGIMVQSKHMAFDGGFEGDFDGMIDKHVADSGAKVVIDARGEHIS